MVSFRCLLLLASVVIGHTAAAPSLYESPKSLQARAGSSGCGKSPTPSGIKNVKVAGRDRQFIVRVPNGYNKNRPYRLVFTFAWNGATMQDVAGGGSSREAWAFFGMQRATNDDAILVAPQGVNNAWANVGGQDIQFVDAMIQILESELCIDQGQRFAMGFSYGGSMSYSIACSRARMFKAVAVLSGGPLSGCAGGNDPIAYIGFHGTRDTTIPIRDGQTLRDRFVRNNGCRPQSPKDPAPGSGRHITTDYAGCRSGFPVKWIAFDGGHVPAPVDGQGDNGARTYVSGEVVSFFG